MYQKAASGAGSEEVLLESEENKVPTSWSADGRFIAYTSTNIKGNTKNDIWILPLFGDGKPFPFLQSQFNEVDAQFSPDGHWIAYVSDESGSNQVYIAAFPGPGGKWQVSRTGGTEPRWRGDGREIFFLSPDSKLMAVEVTLRNQLYFLHHKTAGTKLGRYEIRSKIGEGGMGEVYLAQDTKLDRKVALKILPADVAADQTRMRRFIQEAKAASALNHPNILTIYEIGQTDSTHFIATEYIEGETLRHHLPSAMRLNEVLDICVQVAGALAAAHAAGIIHRDIKPENIMLRRDGIVKVLDFGLAKLTERLPPDSVDAEAATKALVQTEPGVVMGTVAYMSPEQARGLAVDARTDIFSLGVVIYEMVAGRAPFGGATRSDLIVALLERDPPPLARFTPEAPAELERLVMKTLAKDRDERYQTAKDLLIDLKRLKQKLVVDAEIERSAPPEEFRVPPSGGRLSSAESSPPKGGTLNGAAAQTAVDGSGATSSAEYIVSEIKRHKKSAGLTLATLAIVAAAAVFFYFHRATVLTEKDTILIADFVNTTGDSVFDGALKQALAVQLEQSPFLNIFPDERVQETLKLDESFARRARDARRGAGNLRAAGSESHASRLDCAARQPLRHRARSRQCSHQRSAGSRAGGSGKQRAGAERAG